MDRKRSARGQRALLAAVAALLLTACGGGDDPAPTPPAAVAPSITAQPAAVSVTEGQTAAFSVTASGSAPLAYQWRRNGTDIAGATAAAFSVTATLADSGASFTVVVGNSAGSVTSSAATLTVNAIQALPTITTQPAAASFTTGGTASFTVAATGTPEPIYRWTDAGGADLNDGAGSGALAGATIAGASTPSLTLTSLPASAGGLAFTVRVSNSAGSVTSTPAPLSLSNVVTQSVSASAGGSVRSGDGSMVIDIPPGALDADATFTLSPATSIADFAEEFREVPGTLWNLSVTGGKLVAGRSAQVRFRVDPSALPARSAHAGAGRVRALTSPPGGEDTAWSVVRCEDGAPQTAIGDRVENDWSSQVLFCEGDGRTTAAIGLVINRTPVPGTAEYQVALGTALAGMRNWTWAGVDGAGQVVLAYTVGVPDPANPTRLVDAARVARFSAAGTVLVDTRVPGPDPTSTNLELWPRLRPHVLASNGALAGLWRGSDGGQRRARAEAYGVAPFGSGRLLTQRQFVRTFAVDVPADDDTPLRALDFAPSGELALHEWTRLNLYRSGSAMPRLSQVFGIDFPGRPAGAGDGAASSDGPMAVDAAGNVYKVGLNSVNNAVTSFCSPGCPAIYKYGPTGQPLWFRVLAPGGGAQGPTLALDPQDQPVVRYKNAAGRDLVTRLNAANGDITGGADLGSLAFSGSLNTITFDAAGNTYVGLGRYLARIGPDFSAGSVELLEFGQGQSGDYRAIGADRAGNAYGIFTSGANTASAQFRLLKARYP